MQFTYSLLALFFFLFWRSSILVCFFPDVIMWMTSPSSIYLPKVVVRTSKPVSVSKGSILVSFSEICPEMQAMTKMANLTIFRQRPKFRRMSSRQGYKQSGKFDE